MNFTLLNSFYKVYGNYYYLVEIIKIFWNIEYFIVKILFFMCVYSCKCELNICVLVRKS